ncbi:hypothetical protein PCANC_24154 [Puccinia coronata f. sp. avenae]|uniref:Uncharacterized protein n=1 Tax=Puccinia coronata f. sp. avenae TaxID=200324 RepID=A0A2N5TY38_9BASI|nr:hypothetical protein PCANC_24154 [Puccinia coronata f. sp. avenae]
MEDVWHGSVWQEFPNADDGSGIYTSHLGHLVFSLYLDWFNAEGSSNQGKHNSVGAIVLICLNLPPTQRYKVENVFLFGITSGFNEPHLDKHPFAPKPGLPNKGKRKRVDTETKNSTSNVPPKRIRAAALKRNGREEPTSTSRRLPTGSASSSSTEATSDLAATHFYQLRLWKNGMCDLTEELTTDSDDEDL